MRKPGRKGLKLIGSLLKVAAAAAGIAEEMGTWVPAVCEITDEQGGLCDDNINGPAHSWASGGQKQERGQWKNGWREEYKFMIYYLLEAGEKMSKVK